MFVIDQYSEILIKSVNKRCVNVYLFIYSPAAMLMLALIWSFLEFFWRFLISDYAVEVISVRSHYDSS